MAKMSDPRIVPGSRWRHLKTGGVYRVFGECMIERDWKHCVLYCKVDHDIASIPIARPTDEFFDGRFVEIEPK